MTDAVELVCKECKKSQISTPQHVASKPPKVAQKREVSKI